MAAIPFHRFVPEVIGVALTPGQSVVCKVAVDGMAPETDEEKELFSKIFGGCKFESITWQLRITICLLFGRGSGKTTWAAWLAIYLAITVDVSRCGPGDIPTVAIIATDKATAQETCLSMVMAYLDKVPSLKRMVIYRKGEVVSLLRPDGKKVHIKVYAADKGGRKFRGRSFIAGILEEAQFFNTDIHGRFAVNDRDIYNALTPRLMAGGRIVFISTPWPTENLMSELFEKNFGHPETALCGKAPSLLMRPDDIQLADRIALMKKQDPENAAREYDCIVDIGGSGSFFDKVSLEKSVQIDVPEFLDPNRYPVSVSVDFAFESDSSTAVAVQYDGSKYNVLEVLELVPSKGHPLVPSEVCNSFALFAKKYGVTAVISDGHYRLAVKEHLNANGIALLEAPEGITGKNDVYLRTKACLDQGWLSIPNDPRFIRQARSITAKALPGGLLQFRAPRRLGEGHGDIVSAWTLCIHKLAYGRIQALREQRPIPGSNGWMEYRKKRFDEAVEDHETKSIRAMEKSIKSNKVIERPSRLRPS